MYEICIKYVYVQEGLIHDEKLNNVIGCYSIDIPTNVFKRGKGRTSHDTLQYATNGWSTWCLQTATKRRPKIYLMNTLLNLY